MKNTIITLASVATLAVSANAQTWASTISDQSGGINSSAVTGVPDLFDSVGRTTDYQFGAAAEYVTYDFGAAGISDALGDILVWETTGGGANSPEFASIDVLLSNDGISFTSIKSSEVAGFLTGTEVAGAEAKDARSYDVAAFGATARYLKIESNAPGFDLNTVGANAVAVPEPSSTALLGLGGLALILRRRK